MLESIILTLEEQAEALDTPMWTRVPKGYLTQKDVEALLHAQIQKISEILWRKD